MDTDTDSYISWPDAIYAQFRRVGIRQVGYVPDAGHSRLIKLCQDDPNIADVVLTTEEEGVASSPARRSVGSARRY
jgi:sulfopyruvate decarboxylase TPP-binding subunit